MPRITFTDVDGVIKEPSRWGYAPTLTEVLSRYSVTNPSKVQVMIEDRDTGDVTNVPWSECDDTVLEHDTAVTITKQHHASGVAA